MDKSPLQRAREQRGLSQQAVADLIGNVIGPARGYADLGIDANAVSRHERGIIAMPRAPYPDLYAELYDSTIEALWPASRIESMERRRFLQALAATPLATMLPGADLDVDAITTVTGGFRRLEATTPASELRGPVLAHLRFVAHRLDTGGRQLAAAASEAAGFAAWLAVDQADHSQARQYYRRAVGYAERSGSDLLAAYMLGSMAMWAAEVGRVDEARDLISRAYRHTPQTAPATVQAWSAAIDATRYASAGHADDTFAALNRAENAVARTHDPLWPWLFPFDGAKLAGYLGTCATRLGLSKTAIPALDDALNGLGPARTKQRALIVADLAINHRALGHDDQAKELADEARAIGVERGSEKVLRRIRQLV
jgi:tetratricopeptide (TPR) repeat protein